MDPGLFLYGGRHKKSPEHEARTAQRIAKTEHDLAGVGCNDIVKVLFYVQQIYTSIFHISYYREKIKATRCGVAF